MNWLRTIPLALAGLLQVLALDHVFAVVAARPISAEAVRPDFWYRLPLIIAWVVAYAVFSVACRNGGISFLATVIGLGGLYMLAWPGESSSVPVAVQMMVLLAGVIAGIGVIRGIKRRRWAEEGLGWPLAWVSMLVLIVVAGRDVVTGSRRTGTVVDWPSLSALHFIAYGCCIAFLVVWLQRAQIQRVGQTLNLVTNDRSIKEDPSQ